MPEDQTHLNPELTKQKKKPIFSQNAGIFLICIGMASVFWLLINLSNKFESTINLPVEYINFPADKVLTKELPSMLILSVTAPGWELLSSGFKKNDHQIKIDLSNYELSRFINTSAFLSEISGQLPFEFSLSKISPTIVQLSMEEKKSKRVPIVPVFDLTFQPQYDISGPVITEPDSVTVSGASSYIADLKEWKTELIDQKNVDADLNLTVRAEAVNNISMSLSESEIKCYIPVDQYTEKTYENIPIEMINCDQNEEIMIYPNNVKLTFQVSLSEFDKVSASQFQVAINCSAIDLLNSQKAELIITSKPDYVKGLTISPLNVDFIIYK